MTGLLTLAKRNIRLYFADRTAVFLSLLGALIAIFIILIFLKSSIVDGMTADFAGLVSKDQVSGLLDSWLIASAAVIAAATTGLGALRQYVSDRETARWRDFLITPLPRWVITGGYLLSAIAVSALMTTVVFGLGTIYCLATGVTLLAGDILVSWGWLMLCCVSFTALMGFVVSLLRTDAAFTGVSIVVGVMFGFLAETYATAGALPLGVARILNALPFAQASALVRTPYTAAVIAELPAEVRSVTCEQMGMTLYIDSTLVTTALIVAVLGAMIVVFAFAAWQVMARTVKR
ncbi:MAG: hypothetical protein LBE83_06300 [Propionibacteriaceae bacterium]|jgi:multidrug/hemolysin transport system permease protein|nr:hypothetical protein [Propionibacteriaceae bacterium]